MISSRKSSSIRAPTQVRGGIDGALGGPAQRRGGTAQHDAVQRAAQRHRVDWRRRLAARPPCFLVGIGEQRFAHDGEARTAVGAVFIGDAFYPKRTRTHGGAPHVGIKSLYMSMAASDYLESDHTGKPSS